MVKQKRNLSRQRVIDAAIDYADHHDISSLTLPSLARKLHVRSQSLYNYVANRNELISLASQELLDRIYDQAVQSIAGLSGRQAIIKFADIGRAVLIQHQSLSFIIVDVQQVEKNQIISAAIHKLLELIDRVCEQLERGSITTRNPRGSAGICLFTDFECLSWSVKCQSGSRISRHVKPLDYS